MVPFSFPAADVFSPNAVVLKRVSSVSGVDGPNCGTAGHGSTRAVQMAATARQIFKISGVMAVSAAILLSLFNRT
jgi:hypothetical protein